MRRLNNKGYLTIEVILAATIALLIAFFLIEVTVDFSNKTDDYYKETNFISDKYLIADNIKKQIQKDIDSYGVISDVYNDANSEWSNIVFYNSMAYEEEGLISVADDVVTYSDNGQDPTIYYSKELSSNITNITVNGKLSRDNKYALFTIKGEDVLSKSSFYEINILIKNEVSNKKLHIDVTNIHNAKKSVLIQVNIDNNDSINLLDYLEADFIENQDMNLICYINKDKTEPYDYETLNTIRYQSWDDLIITNQIPNELYCDATEQ